MPQFKSVCLSVRLWEFWHTDKRCQNYYTCHIRDMECINKNMIPFRCTFNPAMDLIWVQMCPYQSRSQTPKSVLLSKIICMRVSTKVQKSQVFVFMFWNRRKMVKFMDSLALVIVRHSLSRVSLHSDSCNECTNTWYFCSLVETIIKASRLCFHAALPCKEVFLNSPLQISRQSNRRGRGNFWSFNMPTANHFFY